DAPDQPEWVQTRSLGLPEGARITCAAEVEGGLYAGTAEHGLWAYLDRKGPDGRTLPAHWTALPLAEPPPAKPEAGLPIIARPGEPDRLVVRTSGSVVLLSRQPEASWVFAGRLDRGLPRGLTASATAAYLVEGNETGATTLREVVFQGGAARNL